MADSMSVSSQIAAAKAHLEKVHKPKAEPIVRAPMPKKGA